MFDNVLSIAEDDDYNKSKETPDVNTDRMEAGYNALFAEDGESGMDNYWTVRGEREELGSSPTSEMLKSTLHEQETDSINLGKREAILDPTRSMEDRVAISQMNVATDRK